MYTEQLEAIIDAALADGVLTDKEREVLHKRAAQEGIDADELDVVIEGRLAKMKKEEDWLRPTPPPVQPLMSNKMGNVMKCPSCGAAYEPGTVKCPECGHYFQNISANSSAKELSEGLQNILDGGLGFFSHDKTIFKCSQFIKDFPIPNTKDDMLEFLITLDNKRKTRDGLRLQGAYSAKYKEVVKKAEYLFGDDKQIQSTIEKTNKFSFANITLNQWTIIGAVLLFLLFFLFCCSVLS
jgi:hypothetical protein